MINNWFRFMMWCCCIIAILVPVQVVAAEKQTMMKKWWLIGSSSISPDGTLICSDLARSGSDHRIVVFDLTKQRATVVANASNYIIGFSPDSSQLLFAEGNRIGLEPTVPGMFIVAKLSRTTKLWKRDSHEVTTFPDESFPTGFFGNSELAYIENSAFSSPSVKFRELRNTSTGEREQLVRKFVLVVPREIYGFAEHYAASSDGRFFAICFLKTDGSTKSFSAAVYDSQGKLICCLPGAGPGLCFSPDGTKLLTNGKDLTLWNCTSGKALWSTELLAFPFEAGTPFVSNRFVAIPGRYENGSRVIDVFDVNNGRIVKTIATKAKSFRLTTANKLVVLSRDGACLGKIYDLNSGNMKDFQVELPSAL